MTPQQQIYYNQLIQYIQSLSNTKQFISFCLDKNFYARALPTANLTTADKRVLGKQFKQDVMNKTVSATFNYLYGHCPRCGYKDSSNKIHYVII